MNATHYDVRLAALAVINSVILLRIQNPTAHLLQDMPESLASIEGATYLAAVMMHYAQDARAMDFFTQSSICQKNKVGDQASLYKGELGELLRRAFGYHEHNITREDDHSLESFVASLTKRVTNSFKSFPLAGQSRYSAPKDFHKGQYGGRSQGSHPSKRGTFNDDQRAKSVKHPRNASHDKDATK